MSNLTPDQRAKRIENLVKIAGLAIAGFFAAPFVFIAIKGLLGLVAAAIVGTAIIWFTPVFASMAKNWRLKALKAEAARNPVETLQNQYINEQGKLTRARSKIAEFNAAILQYKDKLAGFIKRFPEEADKYKDVLNKMKALYNLRVEKYQEAEKKLADFKLVIHKADAIWQMSMAANELGEAAGMTDEDFFAELQKETAFDSVQKSLNMALAELETSLLDEADGAKVPELDGQPVKVGETVTKEKIGINN